MQNTSRRSLLGLIAAAPLAACAATTSNGVTTVTLNVQKMDSYAQAIKSGANTLLGIPVINQGLGGATVSVSDTIADVANSIAALDTANKGSVSFTFDTANIPSFVTSLVNDAKVLFTNFQTVVTSLGASVSSQVTEVWNAFQTVVAVLSLLIPGFVSDTAYGPKLMMGIDDALATLGA